MRATVFDASHDLSPDGPTTAQLLMRLCIECRAVFARSEDACPRCESTSCIPFLDRRPLLLSPAALDAVLRLIDATVEQLSEDMFSEDFDSTPIDVLVFLSELLSDTDRAKALRANGHHAAYRLTSVSEDELTVLASNLVVPPTAMP